MQTRGGGADPVRHPRVGRAPLRPLWLPRRPRRRRPPLVLRERPPVGGRIHALPLRGHGGRGGRAGGHGAILRGRGGADQQVGEGKCFRKSFFWQKLLFFPFLHITIFLLLEK